MDYLLLSKESSFQVSHDLSHKTRITIIIKSHKWKLNWLMILPIRILKNHCILPFEFVFILLCINIHEPFPDFLYILSYLLLGPFTPIIVFCDHHLPSYEHHLFYFRLHLTQIWINNLIILRVDCLRHVLDVFLFLN